LAQSFGEILAFNVVGGVGGMTINITNPNLNFAGAFAQALDMGAVITSGISYVGNQASVTGLKASADRLAEVRDGAGGTTFPGAGVGTPGHGAIIF
jgi:hypothetical protein